MTVSSTTRTAGPFVRNGSQTAYPFTFRVFAATDILAVQTDAADVKTTLVLGSDYTVAVNADQRDNPGGTLNMLDGGGVAGHTLDLTTTLEATQGLRLTTAGGFYPEAIENALDKLTILLQQISVDKSQVLRAPFPEVLDQLPPAPDRLGLQLLFHPTTGQPYLAAPVSGTAADVLVQLAAIGVGKGSRLVGTVAEAAGAVARTQHDKNAETLSAKDFAVVGDGVADDTAALQAALTAAAGRILYIPPGTYRITTGLLAPTNTTIQGAGRDATLIIYTGVTTIPGATGTMLRWENASAISLRDIGFRVTNSVISNATKMLLLRNCVYFDITDMSFGGGTTTSGQAAISAIVCDQTTTGFVPPRGNGVFRNILAVVEPPDAGAPGTAGIYIKGHASQAMNSIVLDGEGNIEHFAFGVKIENAANCYVGAWQIRGNTDTEIALVSADSTSIVGTNIIPSATIGKAVTIDASCEDTLILNPSINISSGLPTSCITDLGSRTTIIGQGAPGAQTFAGKLPGAWVMGDKPDGIGPNLAIVRSTTDTAQSGLTISRSGSSLSAPAFFGIATGGGIGAMDIERFEVGGVARERMNANGQRFLYVPDGTPGGSALANSQLTFYLSQSTNQLTALCKYSDGTVKTVTWNLS